MGEIFSSSGVGWHSDVNIYGFDMYFHMFFSTKLFHDEEHLSKKK